MLEPISRGVINHAAKSGGNAAVAAFAGGPDDQSSAIQA